MPGLFFPRTPVPERSVFRAAPERSGAAVSGDFRLCGRKWRLSEAFLGRKGPVARIQDASARLSAVDSRGAHELLARSGKPLPVPRPGGFFALATSINLKFDDGFTEKRLLREAFRGRLPDAIIDKRKFPYRAPDAAAFAAQRPDYLDLVLSDGELEKNAVPECEIRAAPGEQGA
ncbi:asparagine synthase-related protein [Roseibium salinum]|nr:asparagine synthase-related protein [Roseibium salinum]